MPEYNPDTAELMARLTDLLQAGQELCEELARHLQVLAELRRQSRELRTWSPDGPRPRTRRTSRQRSAGAAS